MPSQASPLLRLVAGTRHATNVPKQDGQIVCRCILHADEPFFTSADPRINLRVWDRDALSYERKFGEKIPKGIRKLIYQTKVAPTDVQQQLVLNSNCLDTPDDVGDEIERYCDAREELPQSQGFDPFVAAVTDKPAKNLKRTPPSKDKGRGRCNGYSQGKGKCDGGKGFGKCKDEDKDKEGKGKNYKGKGHKGLGKDPSRSEAERFGGKCNWCWRICHKEGQC
jgi:hypothetical protein